MAAVTGRNSQIIFQEVGDVGFCTLKPPFEVGDVGFCTLEPAFKIGKREFRIQRLVDVKKHGVTEFSYYLWDWTHYKCISVSLDRTGINSLISHLQKNSISTKVTSKS
jgi:hypothetical protein